RREDAALKHRQVLTANRLFPHGPPAIEIYTLSLHDALPILCSSERLTTASWRSIRKPAANCGASTWKTCASVVATSPERHSSRRSEEHTSELQSRGHLVCRLLLEKKKAALLRRQRGGA